MARPKRKASEDFEFKPATKAKLEPKTNPTLDVQPAAPAVEAEAAPKSKDPTNEETTQAASSMNTRQSKRSSVKKEQDKIDPAASVRPTPKPAASHKKKPAIKKSHKRKVPSAEPVLVPPVVPCKANGKPGTGSQSRTSSTASTHSPATTLSSTSFKPPQRPNSRDLPLDTPENLTLLREWTTGKTWLDEKDLDALRDWAGLIVKREKGVVKGWSRCFLRYGRALAWVGFDGQGKRLSKEARRKGEMAAWGKEVASEVP